MSTLIEQELSDFKLYDREMKEIVSSSNKNDNSFKMKDFADKTEMFLSKMVKVGLIKSNEKKGYIREIEYVLEGQGGHAISYSRLGMGIEKCYIKKKNKYSKVWYRLYINQSVPYHVSNKNITKSAIEVLSLIEALKRISVDIELYAVCRANGSGEQHASYMFPIKKHNDGERYDVGFYLNQLTGEFFRDKGFKALEEIYMNKYNSVPSGLGTAVKLKSAVNLWEIDTNEILNRIADDLHLQVIKKLID